MYSATRTCECPCCLKRKNDAVEIQSSKRCCFGNPADCGIHNYLSKEKENNTTYSQIDILNALIREYDLDFHMIFGIDLRHSYDDGNCEYLAIPEPEDCVYTRFYSEENVWHLCNHVRKKQPCMFDYVYAVFLSNDEECIPMWEQKFGEGGEKLIYLDYHVFFMFRKGSRCSVYDLDCCLPFPCDFNFYYKKAIRNNRMLPVEQWRKVRLVSAYQFVENFSSSRSHMRDKNGKWLSPPPSYEPICTDEEDNLADFTSMSSDCGYGCVMALSTFVRKYSPIKKAKKRDAT